MSILPLHVHLDLFKIDEGGALLINGRIVNEIFAEAGGPCYVYDSSVITQRVETLRNSLPVGIELHYAMKANPMPAVVNHLAKCVDGIDVASGRELTTALATGCNRVDISFAGPGKSVYELEQAFDAGIVVNVESETELSRLAVIATDRNKNAKVAVRVNPDFELKSSGMRMSGGPQPFGIDAEKVPEIIAGMASQPFDFQGLHIFSGSQNLSADAICEAQSKSMDLALELCAYSNTAPRFLNLGGGFGIPYFPGDERLQIEPISQNLAYLQKRLRGRYPECRIVLELGRYLVGEAGVYLCEVTDIKISRGHKFLITNGGLHHHLSASGNFGQIIRKNYPVAIATKMSVSESENVSVVGPLCTPLDLLASKMDLPTAEIGDLVAVFQSGAYGFTASPHLFLSHPPPIEMLL